MLSKISKNNLKNQSHFYHEKKNKKLGFWIYMMSDCIIFTILFLTYMIISSTADNLYFKKNFLDIPFVLKETMILLISSLTFSFAHFSFYIKNKKNIYLWLLFSFLCGLIFISMEIYEFLNLFKHGYYPQKNAFFSIFYTLIGTHGIHVFVGIVWILVLIIQISIFDLNEAISNRMMCLSIFWHFLDIIWIFVFSIIYLLGVI